MDARGQALVQNDDREDTYCSDFLADIADANENQGRADSALSAGSLFSAEVDSHLRAAARDGDVDAMVALAGELNAAGHHYGAGYWYTRAGEAGDDRGMYQLGLMAQGDGDAAAARNWHLLAAVKGNAYSMWELAVVASDNGDQEKAERWCRRAAGMGHPEAMFRVGVRALNGDNRAAAEELFIRAVALGHHQSMDALGMLHEHRGDIAGAIDCNSGVSTSATPTACSVWVSYSAKVTTPRMPVAG